MEIKKIKKGCAEDGLKVEMVVKMIESLNLVG